MKKQIQSKLSSIFQTNSAIIILVIIVAVSLVWNTLKVVQRNYNLQADLQRLESEISLLEVENQNLAYEIEYYKTDEFLEVAARKSLNKAAPGESIVYLPKETNDVPLLQVESAEQAESNFDSWIDFLSGKSSL